MQASSAICLLQRIIGALIRRLTPPINEAGELPAMQITVTVSDAVIREAGVRGLPILDFIESLIDKGMSAATERPVLDNAIERIRALRSPGQGSRH
jgi:hypothetical protein